MDRTEYLFAAALALGCIAAVAPPVVVLLSRPRYSQAQVAGARRMRWSSAYVVAVAVCHATNVTLASHLLNVIAEVFALMFGLGLAGFSFILRPRAVGILGGLCALVAWLMLMLFLALGVMSGGGGAGREVALPDGSVCREAGYGMIGSDSGSDVTVFRRFLFVDKRIATHRYSVDDPEDSELTYPDQAILRQCRAALSAARGPARGI